MKIGIIGGGIGGTATARALLNKGFDVTIFEQAPAFGEVGAGVQITPNAVKAIMGLGLEQALDVSLFFRQPQPTTLPARPFTRIKPHEQQPFVETGYVVAPNREGCATAGRVVVGRVIENAARREIGIAKGSRVPRGARVCAVAQVSPDVLRAHLLAGRDGRAGAIGNAHHVEARIGAGGFAGEVVALQVVLNRVLVDFLELFLVFAQRFLKGCFGVAAP